jgi:hypothetical protein
MWSGCNQTGGVGIDSVNVDASEPAYSYGLDFSHLHQPEDRCSADAE